jgi:hypothetical protein
MNAQKWHFWIKTKQSDLDRWCRSGNVWTMDENLIYRRATGFPGASSEGSNPSIHPRQIPHGFHAK